MQHEKYLPRTVFLLMKMLLSGSPSFHSCWQFPSISWTRPLLLGWLVGTSFAGCYASSQPPVPNRLSPAPPPWLCPIVALETEKQTVNGGRLAAGCLCQWLVETSRIPPDDVRLECLVQCNDSVSRLCAFLPVAWATAFISTVSPTPSSIPR